MMKVTDIRHAPTARPRTGAPASTAALLALTLLLLAGSPGVSAAVPAVGRSQETAAQSRESTVSGRVIDGSGWVVPGVSVTLRRPAAAFEQTTETDSEGRFHFERVPDGAYSLSARLAGFSVARKDVFVGRDPLVVDFTLRTGAFAEDVTAIGARLVGSDEALQRTPGSVDLLTRDLLERSHVASLNEALRKLPGVYARDDDGLGLRPHIGIRGLNPSSSTKVLLLEDGVPLTYAPYGDNAGFFHPPIERFSEVEVLKGSGQIAQGPATVGGILNYITPAPPARPSVAVSLTGGNHAYFNGHVSVGGTWGNSGVLIDVTRKQSDGAREDQHAAFNDVTGKITHQLTPGQSVMFKGTHYGETSEIGLSGLREHEYLANPRQNLFPDDELESLRNGVTGSHRALLGDRVALTTTGYLHVYRQDSWWQSANSSQRPRNPADPTCEDPLDLSAGCGNTGQIARFTLLGIEPRLRVDHTLFGLPQETDVGARVHGEIQDRRREKGIAPTARSGPVIEDNRRSTEAVGGFLQHRFLLGRWTITPGVRLERMRSERTNHLASDGRGVTGNATLTEVVPGIGVAYAMSPRATAFAGMHRGFAPPRVEDLIDNETGGVVELEAERSRNTEVGVRTWPAPGLRVDATFFEIDYDNQILASGLVGGTGAVATNGGSTLHRGLESVVSVDSATLTRGANNVYARLAATWLPVARFTGVRFAQTPDGDLADVVGNRVPFAPEALTTLTVGYGRIGLFDVQLEAQRVGEQFSDDINTVPGSAVNGQRGIIPAYTFWNAAATWYLRQPRASIFVTIKNLGDRTFIVDRSRGILPSHPRLVQVGTTWRF